MLKLLGNPDLPYVTIMHKFLETDHSFLSNDANFTYIEKRLKYHPEVYTPHPWYEIIKEARMGENNSLW